MGYSSGPVTSTQQTEAQRIASMIRADGSVYFKAFSMQPEAFAVSASREFDVMRNQSTIKQGMTDYAYMQALIRQSGLSKGKGPLNAVDTQDLAAITNVYKNAYLQGVDSGYLRSRRLHQRLIVGTPDLGDPLEVPRVVLGEGLDYRLNLNPADQMQGINAIVPDRQSTSIVNPEIVNLRLVPSGVFRLDDEIGNRYAYVSLDFASELFSRDQEYSQLEIMFRSGAQAQNVTNAVQVALGKDFEIRDRRRQNEALFKMFRTEKWATFAILCFVLGIISFNLTGALYMLVIEKKELEAKNAEERIKEYAIEILDDKDLDYSKTANVEKILNKYKNTQNNRRNFEPD